MVSGGDVLVQLTASDDNALKNARVALNGADVTSVFRAAQDPRALVGLVTVLKLGRNTLEVTTAASQGIMAKILTGAPPGLAS